MSQSPAIVLFTRDLRTRDHPALAEAARTAERVVPLFVLDHTLLERSPRRSGFLLRCLHALDGRLRELGGRLVVRTGDPVAETVKLAREVGAATILTSADVSGYAQRREQRLQEELPELDVRALPGLLAVEPGEVAPSSSTHYRVFTPYWRAWQAAAWRPAVDAPDRVLLPEGLVPGELPEPPAEVCELEPDAGEQAAWARVESWIAAGLAEYGDSRDDLGAGATSRLSAYLRFGCLSPLELATRVGGGEFRRQLAWRDFYAQLLWANPAWEHDDMYPLRYEWDEDGELLAAWQEGRTGYPIVDAAMRQLEREGFMHNRARMIVSSFLTKDLNLDWRLGAAHFDRLLLDGDPASNVGGWQWVAGTGADSRPGRMFNPTRQAVRFDPDGDYVRRYLPELEGLAGGAVHDRACLDEAGYTAPVVDHAEAARRYRARFARDS